MLEKYNEWKQHCFVALQHCYNEWEQKIWGIKESDEKPNGKISES